VILCSIVRVQRRGQTSGTVSCTRLGFELGMSRLQDDVLPIHRLFDSNAMEQCPHSDADTLSVSEETSHTLPEVSLSRSEQPAHLSLP
jgi:hypothetical protein